MARTGVSFLPHLFTRIPGADDPIPALYFWHLFPLIPGADDHIPAPIPVVPRQGPISCPFNQCRKESVTLTTGNPERVQRAPQFSAGRRSEALFQGNSPQDYQEILVIHSHQLPSQRLLPSRLCPTSTTIKNQQRPVWQSFQNVQ